MAQKFLRKSGLNFCMYTTLGRSRNDLDLQYSHTFINSNRCLLLPTFRSLAAIVSEKSNLSLFPMKTISYQILPCCKIGQGQPRVIIYIHFVELESPMLHAKFQDHRTFGSGEDFLRFLPYMSMAAILVM